MRGSKGKYEEIATPENLIRIQGWRRDGLADNQICKNLGIGHTTLYRYIKQHEEFRNAYKKGTEVCTYEVENALYKSAMGHFVEEMEVIETISPEGLVTTTKRKHRRYVPPSTGAQVFILKNRRPDWWRDSRTIETKNDGQLAALIDGLKEPCENKE